MIQNERHNFKTCQTKFKIPVRKKVYYFVMFGKFIDTF